MFPTILAAVILIATAATVLRTLLGERRLQRLEDQDPTGIEHWPSVSIVVAARNEERHIQVAIESLVEIDYDDCEILVVNDRSTDRTGAILESLATRHERLTVRTVDQLPAGWLGKNHAQWVGARAARGEYLLLTDADVVMDPPTLRHAMAFTLREEADHVAASPGTIMPTLMLQAFVVLFVDVFALFTRPWKVSDPKSAAHVGIGAFNLVRAEIYQAVGTHQRIAMRPDDDLKLGKIIKLAGYRQRFVIGTDMIRVPWYGSLGELISGMEKNAFSGVDYRVWMVVGGTAVLVLFGIWPFLAVWVTDGVDRLLYLATILLLLLRSLRTALRMRQQVWSAFFVPITIGLLIYIQWRAMLLTYINGGIRWRDTHYALEELKANKV